MVLQGNDSMFKLPVGKHVKVQESLTPTKVSQKATELHPPQLPLCPGSPSFSLGSVLQALHRRSPIPSQHAPSTFHRMDTVPDALLFSV